MGFASRGERRTFRGEKIKYAKIQMLERAQPFWGKPRVCQKRGRLVKGQQEKNCAGNRHRLPRM